MTHRNLSELLPWYVNDSLSLEERSVVESEIDACAECAADVEELTSLRDYLLEKDAAVEGPSQTLLAKTLARIEREEHAPRSIGKLWASLAGLGWLLAALPAVAAVVIVGHFAFGAGGWFASPATSAGGGEEVANLQLESPNGPVPVNLPVFRRSLAKAASAGAPSTVSGSVADEAAQNAAAPAASAPQIIRTGSISLL